MDERVEPKYFGHIVTLYAIILFFSPLLTTPGRGPNDQYSVIPYAITILGCLLYDWHGLHIYSPNHSNVLISALNAMGAVVGSLHVVIFLRYASKHEKGNILRLLALVLTFLAADAFVSVFALHSKEGKVFSGTAAAIFSIIMYGSPPTVIMILVRAKHLEFMPPRHHLSTK